MTQFEKKYAVVIVVLLLFLSIGTALAQPSEPHLVNPSFEDGFYEWQGIGEVKIANGWFPAYLEGNDGRCPSPCHRPEYQPEQQPQYVTDGQYSQRWFATFARMFGTLYQRVDVQQGEWYEFSCDVYAISSPPAELGVFVGINPWGTLPFERVMVWGREQVGDQGWIYDEWVRVSVTAQAWSDMITVAIGANNKWATRGNTAYVDKCAIRRVDIGSPEPLPTYTPYLTPEPCPTHVPGGECNYGVIRGIVREELDRTGLGVLE